MRLFLTFLSLSFLLLILGGAGGMFWAYRTFTAPGPSAQAVGIIVARGANIGGVAGDLHEKGLIGEPLFFEIAGRLSGQAPKIKAGEYEFPAGVSMKEILGKLERGETIQRRFTIPEGLTVFEIVRLLDGVEYLEGEVGAPPAEGMLLPDTYDYQRGESRASIMVRLRTGMSTLLKELCGIQDGNTGPDAPCPAPEPLKTVREVLTLASIVEKETGKAEERPRIAGVFLNRLRRGIPLQTDPTVIYAITRGEHHNDGKGPLGRRLLTKDLDVDSPYNTYKYPGLPPGPIANPGRAALEAVLHPETHDYLYFVADGTGGHVFAATLAEHNRNVAAWRKIRRER